MRPTIDPRYIELASASAGVRSTQRTKLGSYSAAVLIDDTASKDVRDSRSSVGARCMRVKGKEIESQSLNLRDGAWQISPEARLETSRHQPS